jgi:3',5'-cyclic AMP phosphodiesterase CpdA
MADEEGASTLPVSHQDMERVMFESSTLRIACISDTYNGNCREHVPLADVVIHAGDFTDDGTLEELQIALDWITALPHKVNAVVAGTFDHKRENFSRQSRVTSRPTTTIESFAYPFTARQS